MEWYYLSYWHYITCEYNVLVKFAAAKTYRAISIAPALPGKFQSCKVDPDTIGIWLSNSPGITIGDEKDSRYNAMKKSSFRAQTRKRTYCIGEKRGKKS